MDTIDPQDGGRGALQGHSTPDPEPSPTPPTIPVPDPAHAPVEEPVMPEPPIRAG